MGNILVTGVSDLDRMELGEMGIKPSTAISLLSPHLGNTLFSSPRSKGRLNQMVQHGALRFVNIDS